MTRYPLYAHYIKNSLNLAKIEQKNKDLKLVRKERNLLVFQPQETQFICVLSFGAVVLFGIENKRESSKILRRFGKALEDEHRIMTSDGNIEEVPPENYDVIVDPDVPEAVEFDLVRLKHMDLEKLLLVFHVAAQSVALDFLEERIDRKIGRFERIHNELAERGKLIVREREVMRIIGQSGNVTNFIIDKLSLLDKPDTTWEDRDAETLHASLRKAFELDDRFSAIRFKLEFIKDSAEVALNVLENRKAAYLEIIIILLIAIEFLFFILVEVH